MVQRSGSRLGETRQVTARMSCLPCRCPRPHRARNGRGVNDVTQGTATAIAQCIAYGTPTYLLRQAIDRGHVQGYLKTAERDELARALQARDER